MYQITGSQALAVARSTKNRAWSGSRFDKDFFSVDINPKFKTSKNTKIFTMGSCFAREVENQLIKDKVPLVTATDGISPEHFESWNEETGTGGGVRRGQTSRGAFNKYTINSMAHEIRRVLLKEEHKDNGLIEISPNEWFDPHASGLKSGSIEVVKQLRQQVADATAKIRDAEVVFLTLGLVEGWVDSVTGLAMNRAPGGRALVRLADRFNFVVPDYAESLVEMDNCISLIRKICNPEMKFVLTVSPVPFHATFRPMDVVVANTLSKSLLRTVADAISSKYSYVEYFPSYEMVVNSPVELAWAPDRLHVSNKMVAHVMQAFSQNYIDK
jgi:hypothetical protein